VLDVDRSGGEIVFPELGPIVVLAVAGVSDPPAGTSSSSSPHAPTTATAAISTADAITRLVLRIVQLLPTRPRQPPADAIEGSPVTGDLGLGRARPVLV
jgi:hypothetical protein